MSALLGILGFLAFVTAIGTGYRFWNRRKVPKETGLPAKSVPPTPTVDTTPPKTVLPPPDPAIARPKPTPDPAPPPIAVPPLIPDPWLAEPEQETPPATTAAVTEPLPAQNWDYLLAVIGHAGELGQSQSIAYLKRFSNHAESTIRAAVATALGNIAADKPGKSMEGIIPVLGKLSQDTKPEVRLAAVEALGNIQSPKVLSWLQQAQRTSTGELAKTATASLQRLKLNYQPKSKAPARPATKPRGR
jgi:hypothetical protein